MDSFLMPIWAIWFLVIFIIAILVFLYFIYSKYSKHSKKDSIIIIDEANRWQLIFDDLTDKTKFKHKDKVYFLEKAGLLNKHGRALYIFSKNKPKPFNIRYNKAEWLDSASLMSTINNDLIQSMVKPKQEIKDLLMLFVGVAAVIGSIAAVVNLLIATGVI